MLNCVVVNFVYYDFLLFSQFSGLSLALPQYINLLTFEPWKDNQILIRFEHILEISEATDLTSNITFNLHDVFLNFDIIDLRETTLAANQWKNEASRYTFREDQDNYLSPNIEIRRRGGYERMRYLQSSRHENPEKDGDNDFIISLKPMEIKTFIIRLDWKP